MIYLVPLVLVGCFCAILDTRRLRWSIAVPVVVLVAGYAFGAIPEFTWKTFAPLDPDTPASSLYRPLADLTGGLGGTRVLLAALTVGARRRAAARAARPAPGLRHRVDGGRPAARDLRRLPPLLRRAGLVEPSDHGRRPREPRLDRHDGRCERAGVARAVPGLERLVRERAGLARRRVLEPVGHARRPRPEATRSSTRASGSRSCTSTSTRAPERRRSRRRGMSSRARTRRVSAWRGRRSSTTRRASCS